MLRYDTSLAVKSRQNYGAALTSMREITNDGERLTDDETLAALLLIDSFESMHLARVAAWTT